jgi:hypothetical protein
LDIRSEYSPSIIESLIGQILLQFVAQMASI